DDDFLKRKEKAIKTVVDLSDVYKPRRKYKRQQGAEELLDEESRIHATLLEYGSKTHVASYKLLKTIGQSSYCKVKLARHLPTGTEVAVKMVERSGKSASRARALHCEVQSLKTVRHPNVLKLLEVVATEETSCIVSELVSGGDLLDHIRKSGPMAEDEARGKFRQLA
uniref:non-specific serine/threonine protein kinase n=1 Tax=Equus caballus TaxID=9796 RepID=A0A3Q2L728_HORSE